MKTFGLKGAILYVAALVSLSGCESKTVTTWDTTKVSRNTISNMVTATGTVEPITEVEVGTQVSGIVNKLYADYNSVVKKGQVIAELDKSNLLNEYASRKSSLASAKSEYEYQLKNYTRSKTLHEKNLISDSDYESALYTYETAKNSYDVSKNELAKAQTNLGYATIYSPIDGVVLSRVVEEGQTVNAGMNTPTLFTIANDLTKMRVIADVDEADIGEVAQGQRVTFTVDAYPNDVFEGEVLQLRLEATTESNVVTYEVVVNAPNPDYKLKPGLTANITIYTLEKKDVLTIPSKALRFSPQQYVTDGDGTQLNGLENANLTQKSIWTLDVPNVLTERVVTLGTTNGVLVEVISGLKEGDVVLTGQTVVSQEAAGTGERSPFMPSRPGEKKK